MGRHNGVAAISTYDGVEWTREEFPEVATSFSNKAFAITRDGKVWAAARGDRDAGQVGGVVYGIGDQWTHFAPPFVPRTPIAIIPFDEGRVWICDANGITQYDGQTWSRVQDPLWSAASVTVASAGADGTVWFASRTKGVLRYSDGDFDVLSVDDGLPSHVSQVHVDGENRVWAGTHSGLFRFDGDRFSKVDHAGSILARYPFGSDFRGGLWVNGKHRIGKDVSPPMPELLRTEMSVQLGSEAFVAWKGVDKWNRTASDRLRWSWRIDGEDWTPFRITDHTRLDGLSVGDHVFELRCRDSDFNVMPVSETAKLTVLPPVYMTAWFWFPISVAGMVSALLGVRLFKRGRALREANQDLQSARKVIAERYAEKTAQFKAVCDCSPVGIFVADQEHQITYANPRFAELAGRAPDVLMGEAWLDCIHPEDRERLGRWWDQPTERPESVRLRGRLQREGGEERHFELAADAIEQDGRLLGYVGVMEDVTASLATQRELETVNTRLRRTLDQLKAAQGQMVRHERLTALGQMAAGVAHDINNSLTPLLTYAELLESQPGLSGTGRSWAELVRLGIQDTADTVRRLDHFYRDRQQTHAVEPIDLAKLVQQVVALTRPKWTGDAQDPREIQVTTEFARQPTVIGDPANLRSVLTNLVFNAVDAIGKEGEIKIRVDLLAERALLEVIDNGGGMNADQLKRCTDPFYTTKKQGSGLGLSECYGIVRQHGGELVMESEPGVGTTAKIELPAVQQTTPETPSETAKKRAVAVHTGAMVLCIDDEDMVRASTEALLGSMGVQVLSVPDGPSGLELLQREQVDLVLCDQGLPGMDGLTVMKEIKSRWPEMPVVMVSGWSLPQAEGDCRPDDVIQKPFTMGLLSDVIARHATPTA